MTMTAPVPTEQKLPQASELSEHVLEPGTLYDSQPVFDAKDADGVAIVSGGLDSITTVYRLVDMDFTPHLVSFDYGQRHRKEIDYALACAERLNLRWSLIDLSSLTELISNSALTSSSIPWSDPGADIKGDIQRNIEVPEGHYAEDNMAITVVPNRNMIMISIAAGVAVNYGYKYVAAGMHAGDHAQYPDCRPGFLSSILTTIEWGNEGFLKGNFRIITPYLKRSKNDIAEDAFRLGVPLHLTWSCYKGETNHCGRCGTCVERLEAIDSVKEAPDNWDLTIYEDKESWRQMLEDYRQQHST
jgi:7-cyano-7-deazaguanine synthase